MRLAKLLLCISIGLCSCTAAKSNTAYVPVGLSACPAPAELSVLPGLDGDAPFDSPGNIEALMLRDDIMRQYIKSLRSTIECYKRQVTNETN